MTHLLDCLVGYFGLDEADQPTCRRYYCYHILAGPGPMPGAGMATIATLAIYDEAERCTSCQNFHMADTGGPAAALARAIRYLDAYHGENRLRRVQSAIRDLGGEPPVATAPLVRPVASRVPLFQADSTPTR